MKTPDKIYIAERNAGFTDIVDMMWTYGKRSDPAVTNVDYIRKDTVLEKLRLAWGTISKDPYECNNVFEDLINEIKLL